MKKQPEHRPWLPAPYEPADASAMQALQRGEANADQQTRAFLWVLHQASAVYDLSYHPGGEEGRRDTDFAEGRRFVGSQIIKLTKLNVSQLVKNEEKHA